jgi:hypothetical protein
MGACECEPRKQPEQQPKVEAQQLREITKLLRERSNHSIEE